MYPKINMIYHKVEENNANTFKDSKILSSFNWR